MNTTSTESENLSRRAREKAAHRREIMDAAIKVFAEKGYHSATLDEVAQKAEFSKGALYLYFSSKEDLLLSILTDTIAQWSSFTEQSITGVKTFKEKVTILFSGTAQQIFEKPDLLSLFAQIGMQFKILSDEKMNELIKIHTEVWDKIRAQVEKAIGNGELRELPSFAIVGMIRGSIDAMVGDRWGCTTLDDLLNAITFFIDMLFNGIAKERRQEGE